MQEFGLPPLYHVHPDANLTDSIDRNAERDPDIAVASRKMDGRWRDVTAARFRTEADATVADLAADPDLLAAIQTAVDDGNRAVSQAEAVRKFRMLPTELTEANGYLTPSLKLKRNIVLREFATEVDAMYSG
ncbi:hypothetical protein AB0M34_32620 [Nocardia sp. NPDC050193]